MITSENVENFSVRLAGLPWRWVPVALLFESEKFLQSFSCLSKDGRDHLTVATPTAEGWGATNYWGDSRPQWNLLFIPLGFAADVLRWREQYGRVLPIGNWEDFRNETLTEEEGGSPAAFHSVFIGSMWWVVYPPTMER